MLCNSKTQGVMHVWSCTAKKNNFFHFVFLLEDYSHLLHSAWGRPREKIGCTFSRCVAYLLNSTSTPSFCIRAGTALFFPEPTPSYCCVLSVLSACFLLLLLPLVSLAAKSLLCSFLSEGQGSSTGALKLYCCHL